MDQRIIQEAMGIRLRQARKSVRLTQGAAAEVLGVTRQTVSSWERGETGLSAAQLALLSQTYCTCAHRLLFGESFESINAAKLLAAVRASLPCSSQAV